MESDCQRRGRESASVSDQIMPLYIEIGPPGQFALAMMQAALDAASKAMIEGDTVAMIAAYKELKEFEE